MSFHRLPRSWFIFCATLLVSSCTTLCVKKVNPDDTVTPGVRYALPKLLLKATPAPDGALTMEELYLPDSDNTFAASAESFFATHQLKIEVDKGLLKKVDWTSDTSAVAAEGATQANALATERLKAAVEKEKADQTAITNARKAVADAELAATKAYLKWTTLRTVEPIDPAKIRDALIEYQQALAALEAAQRALNQLIGSGDSAGEVGGSADIARANDDVAGDVASGGKKKPEPKDPENTKRVPGPILYVLEDYGTPLHPKLKLRAVGDYKIEAQAEWAAHIRRTDTHQPEYIVPKAEAQPVTFDLFPKAAEDAELPLPATRVGPWWSPKKVRRITFTSATPLSGLGECTLTLFDSNHQQVGVAKTLEANISLLSPVEIVLVLGETEFPNGIYQLSIIGKDKAGKPIGGAVKVFLRLL